MLFLKELKQCQIGQKLPKMQTQGFEIFGGGPPIPSRGVGPLPHLLCLGTAKMMTPPPFLVPAMETIVMAISNLSKNPG